LGIGPTRMIYVTSEVLSARSVDRPTAVDLEEIAVASGLKFIGLLGRKLATFVFDNEGSLPDRRCRKKTQARAGTADTESSVAGHIRHVRRFAPVQPHRCGSAIDLSAIASWWHVLSGRRGYRAPSSNLPTRLPSWPLPGVFGRSLSAHVL